MRVTTAFNRVLGLPGAWVVGVAFTDAGVVVSIRRRERLHRCPCGQVCAGRYDLSRRRWRHLDLGASQLWLEADIARVACPSCRRVRTEQVPWARPGARHTRDFEDVIAWLAQRMDKTGVSRLLRCSWDSVDRAVQRVVADHLDPARLDDLVQIGVDEISYKRGHHYLTVVADHTSGRVVWVAKTRTQAAFEEFFTELGPDRVQDLQAVTCDAASIYASVIAEQAPKARIVLDPFHIIKWANEALDAVYRAEPATPVEMHGTRPVRYSWRRLRHALRSGAERLPPDRRALVNALRRTRHTLWRAWMLKEELRDLYLATKPAHAAKHLTRWITSALRSQIGPFQTLARRLRKHFDAIIAAVELGLSNSRLEGINAKIRVIQRRGYGHPNPDSLTAMIHLCLGGITITLPTRT